MHCFTGAEVTRIILLPAVWRHGCVVRMLVSGRRTWPALWLPYATCDAMSVLDSACACCVSSSTHKIVCNELMIKMKKLKI